MTVAEIIKQLSNHVVGELPAQSLIAASEQREELIPVLLNYLEVIAKQGDDILETQRVDLVFFAFYLLAQFRHQQALPVMLRIVSASPRTVNRLLGFVVSESLPRILASVMIGKDGSCDIEPLQRVIENREVHPRVRFSALTCLTILSVHGCLPREQLLAYFQRLFTELEQERNAVWDGLMHNCIIAGFSELEPSVTQVIEEQLLHDSFVGRERLSILLQAHPGEVRFPPYERSDLIDDCVAELEGWASFSKSEPVEKPVAPVAEIQKVARPWPAKEQQSPEHLPGYRLPTPARNKQAPAVRENPKVGRNDPCPCGSGRKYKKCCGR